MAADDSTSENADDRTLDAWLALLDSLSHYRVLGVDSSISPADLKSAFHAFSESFHPDRHRGASTERKSRLRRIFQRGTEAYRVLRDARLRAAYDLEWAARRSRVLDEPSASDPDAPPPSQKETPSPLDALCLTPAGRLHARQAERALTDGDMSLAEACLEKALRVEGANPALAERLASVRSWLSLR